ncbi:Fic family protein [Fimbriimonas ginsengisoli]|uniref:MloA n=1 Tax=Fimbriimonas ginsengisoli Gsoil 348 TaxID=661478 RepID=A0A068NVG6_FIMGI|nr:Fic/DOC family N-terminal domain-containing protein [Fimbriimonas ginsengisoli]AIE86780.1 MloA [Fimbriimonas ginsengisoli Gsoil 348]
MAHRETFNRPDEPYNDLPALPPLGDLETKAILKAAIDAHVALAELRSAAKTLPDDGILVRAIALQEARISSEIEMVVTTNDELYRALSQQEEFTDPQTKEVLRYGDAIWLGYGHLRKGSAMDVPLLQRLASVILKFDLKIRESRGTRVGDPRTGRVVYTPPIGCERITAMLENLLEYWHTESTVDPLVRLCVIHYQFEAIHPFPDANGRVGRVLNILFLVSQGLLDKPILYLSRAIIEDKSGYYKGLRKVTEYGDWETWVLYMLENLSVTAIETRRRIEAIHHELEAAIDYAEASMRTGYSEELIRLVFSQPYTRISFLERAGIAKRQTASLYLQELERIGILQGEKRGREMYYLNRRLFEILGL